MFKSKKNRENQISKSAIEIVDLAKREDVLGIISIFKKLCIPFYESKESPKVKLFLEIFSLANVDAIWDSELGVVVPANRDLHKTIVSHMDLIPLFNKSFAFEQSNIKNEKKFLSGPLDNSITNAMLIMSILNNQNENVTYLFTKDEDRVCHMAMKTYMSVFGIDQFVINLDVTGEGLVMKNEKPKLIGNASIEFDEPNISISKQINKNIAKAIFTKDRFCDDLDSVVGAGGYGLSYCLPTGPNGEFIHSFENFCFKKSLEPYYNGLNYLIHELDVSDKAKNMMQLEFEDIF